MALISFNLALVPDAFSFRFLALAMAVAVSSPALAQDNAPAASGTAAQQSAYRSSIDEEAVRKQTDKIQAEITELVAELKLNGMDDADLATLSNASSHLQSLSQQDMQKVVNALQSASMATQDQGRQQALVTAYQGQKDVSLKLKSLAADMAAEESQKEIPSKIEGLIARQSANIRQTKTLPGVAVDQLSAGQKTTHDVVSAELGAIGGEIDVLFMVIDATPAPTPEAAPNGSAPAAGAPDVAKAIRTAMNGGSLKGVTDAATQATMAGPFTDAATKQGDVRNALNSLLRISLSNIDPVSQLEQVRAELNQLTSDQKDLGATAQEAKLDGSTLAERQAKIEDRASVTQALLKSLSPAASSQLGQAQQDMETSSSALATAKNPSDTAPQQQAVVDALQKASALLDGQIAAAEKEQTMAPTDKLAQLQQLQSEIQQAQQNPQAAALQKAQQDAAAVSPQAADKIADAQDQMQQAQPDTAAAQQSLAQANAAVQAQEDALKQAAQAYQALNQASQQLQQAQQDAAAASQSIQQNTTGDQTQAAKDLTQAQAADAQAQQAAAQAGAPQDAQQALQQAADALKAATMQAVQAQGAGAQAQAQKAEAAMQQAQAGLGQAMAQIQQQGQGQGKPQPGQQAQGVGGASEAPNQGSQVLGGFGAGGVAQVVGGLKPKDRDAISQYQAEKSPPEYAPLVQQYLKNLADSSQSH
jgi:hypothetical protein